MNLTARCMLLISTFFIGGFEVYIVDDYAHVDVLFADDDETNNVIGPLLAFVQRNIQ